MAIGEGGNNFGSVILYRCCLTSIVIPMLKIRQCHDCLIFKPGLYSMHVYARVYARIRRLSAQLFILLSPVAPSAYARIRRLSPSKFKHVELSRPAQTSAGIPANHESAPRSPRADALICIGTYADVYRRIRSPVYTFIHGATCAMQWRRTGSRKRGHLRRLPAHTRAWSINPAL